MRPTSLTVSFFITFTGFTTILVWFTLYYISQACLRSSHSHPSQPARSQLPTMEFINKLKLERAQKVKVTKFLQEIQRKQEQLKSVYRQEDYVTLTTGKVSTIL